MRRAESGDYTAQAGSKSYPWIAHRAKVAPLRKSTRDRTVNVRHKLDALTALRFFAAAMIVLTHAHPIFGSFGLANAAPLGQGVSFFFVLSGFILAYNYRNFSKDGSISRFMMARFARVWPLHLVTCIIWIGLIFHFDRHTYFGGITGAARLFTNLTLTQTWIPLKLWSLSFNGVSWSISNEAFFYVLFPMLIAIWPRHWAKVFFAATFMVVAFVIAGNSMELRSSDNFNGVSLLGTLYFNPLVRALEFIFGIFLAKLFVTPALQEFKASRLGWLYIELVALAAITGSMVLAGNPGRIADLFGTATGYYFQREGLWLIWGLLIMTFALSKGPISAFLSTKPLVFLGEISFSLYLIHAILITFIEPYASTIQSYGLAGYGVFWMIALISATLLYKGVENPCRHFIMHYWDTKRMSLRQSFKAGYNASALACALAIVIIVAIVHMNRF
jgi:peptidoglycan/LPS O-acetylase OafA/YrhL